MLLLLFTERDGVTELVLSSDVRCLTGHNITTLFLNSVKVTAPSARFYIYNLVSCSCYYNMHVDGLLHAYLCLVTLLCPE